MAKGGVSKALLSEAERALEGFWGSTTCLSDYEFGLAIPSSHTFDEWITDLDLYLGLEPSELEGEKRFIAIRAFLPSVSENRLHDIISQPNLISDDEELDWRRNWYQDDHDEADFLFLVPLQSPEGDEGAAIICSCSNVPGGEFYVVEVFDGYDKAEKFLDRHTYRA